MRINKGICISVSNITFALIMILKMMRKRNEKYVGWKIEIKNKNMRMRIRIRKMKKFGKGNDEKLKMVRNKKENEKIRGDERKWWKKKSGKERW